MFKWNAIKNKITELLGLKTQSENITQIINYRLRLTRNQAIYILAYFFFFFEKKIQTYNNIFPMM